MKYISNEDWEEYKNNAVERLRRDSQYATARAVEIAIEKQICKHPNINEFDEILCPNCGELLLEHDKVCSECGQVLK